MTRSADKKLRSSNPKHKIERVLAEAKLIHKNLTWPELLEKTELSKGALSKHLTEMINYGYVKVDVEVNSKGKREIVHSLVPPSKEHLEKKLDSASLEKNKQSELLKSQDKPRDELVNFDVVIKEMERFSLWSGHQISQINDRKQAAMLLRDYLAFNIDQIAAYIPYFIILAYAYSEGFASARKLKTEKQYEVFTKRLTDEYVKKLLHPWIETLASSAFMNRDIAIGTHGKNDIYGNYAIDRGKNIDPSFIDKMEILAGSTTKR